MIEDHQDLLRRYVKAELASISEFSGGIGRDAKRLMDEVSDYAMRHGLKVDDEWFESYLY